MPPSSPDEAQAMADALETIRLRRERTLQDLSEFMTATALLSPDELAVAKTSVQPTPKPVYPDADIWGAAARNNASFGTSLMPGSRRELKRAKRAYEAKKYLRLAVAEATYAETGIHEIDSTTGRSAHRDASLDTKTSLQRFYPAHQRSIERTEKLHGRSLQRQKKLLRVLSPLEPSVQNIYEQVGCRSLVGLSWQEKQGTELITKKITQLDDGDRYIVEFQSGDGEAQQSVVTEAEFETYMQSSYDRLSNFSMAPAED